MTFSSNIFLFLFLPVALLGYQIASRFGRTATAVWLVLCSLYFYGYWNPKYLLLLIASIALNFAASRLIVRAGTDRGRSAVLWAAVAANLGLLVWFKYLFPVLEFFHAAGWLHRSFVNVLLPLGISFFTFTQIAYLIDLAQGEAAPQGLLSYCLFVTFFPHLIAGPIIHHAEMMPQFNAQRPMGLQLNDMSVGAAWFTLGLAKKVLIADHFGPIADAIYRDPHRYGAQATWVGVLCYAIQLYFDFSGYSDMALALARMFSIRFPFNFNSPYKAASIIDFWQRWHMTLTRYINLYLYNPLALGMSRRRIARGLKATRKAQRTVLGFTEMIGLPLLTTMFLAGIWHGAGMHYLVFGLVHAGYLIVNHAWRTCVPEDSPLQDLLPSPLCVTITFLCVLVGQIFFRAASVPDALHVIATLLGLHHGSGLDGIDGLPVAQNFAHTASHVWSQIIAVFVAMLALPNTQQILGQVPETEAHPSTVPAVLRWRPTAAWTAITVMLLAVAVTMLSSSTSFLYFQF